MNLHGIVSPYIGAVNPPTPVALQISVGDAIQPDGSRVPVYATPGSFTATIGGSFMGSASGNVLTVSTVGSGILSPGDVVSGTDGVNALPSGVSIVEQTGGDPGGLGTYQISAAASVGPCTISSVSSILNVTDPLGGQIMIGQALTDQGALMPGTTVTGFLSGIGGRGTYTVSKVQKIASETMQAGLNVLGQVQPISTRDLAQLEGVNLGGVRWKIYLNGQIDGMVRPEKKGGDLVTILSGRHRGVWLVVQVLEQFPDWVCAAIVLQNDQQNYLQIGPQSQSDAQPSGVP